MNPKSRTWAMLNLIAVNRLIDCYTNLKGLYLCPLCAIGSIGCVTCPWVVFDNDTCDMELSTLRESPRHFHDKQGYVELRASSLERLHRWKARLQGQLDRT